MTPQESEQFIRSFSHEVKNPLTTIKGYAQLLRMRGGDPAFVDKVQSIIIGEVERIEKSFDCFYSLFSVKNALMSDTGVQDILSAAAASAPAEAGLAVLNGCPDGMTVRTNADVAVRALVFLMQLRRDSCPGVSLSLNAAPAAAGCAFTLSYGKPLFASLDEGSFMVPYSAERLFATGAEIFSSYYLLSKIGGSLLLTEQRDGFRAVLP